MSNEQWWCIFVCSIAACIGIVALQIWFTRWIFRIDEITALLKQIAEQTKNKENA
jgi:hypothetical protein